jgi:hypothetical protein
MLRLPVSESSIKVKFHTKYGEGVDPISTFGMNVSTPPTIQTPKVQVSLKSCKLKLSSEDTQQSQVAADFDDDYNTFVKRPPSSYSSLWVGSTSQVCTPKLVKSNLLNNQGSFIDVVQEIWTSLPKSEVTTLAREMELLFEPVIGKWNRILLMPTDGIVTVVSSTNLYGLTISSDRRAVEGIVAFKERKRITLYMNDGLVIHLNISPTYLQRIL